MAPETELTIIIGAGRKGVEWAKRQRETGRAVVAVDIKPLWNEPGFINADVFSPNLTDSLGIESASCIYADFLLNAVARQVGTAYEKNLSIMAALLQMWQLVAPGGQLIIVDTEEKIQRIYEYADKFLRVSRNTLEMQMLPITKEDYERSESLTQVKIEEETNVGKILIKKLIS